jgi:hypothetical protein
LVSWPLSCLSLRHLNTSLVSSNVSLKTPNKWFRIWFS